jgi:hypothetical protein
MMIGGMSVGQLAVQVLGAGAGAFAGTMGVLQINTIRQPSTRAIVKAGSAFGAMALGARDFLLAYNVNLSGENLEAAKAIASQIRERTDGGLPGLRSIGWDTPEFGCSQVSCNVTDLSRLALKEVYDTVDLLARNFGLAAAGSELIGMPPLRAFRGFSSAEEGANYLGLSSVVPFDVPSRVIEYRFA